MDEALERILAVIGFFTIVFIIFFIGFSKGMDHKEEKNKKISIEQRISNLENKIYIVKKES